MIQRTLSGRYVLEEELGSGGMAEVYRARDKLLDRPVAVKILHAAYRSDSEFISRFHLEAKSAARLSHPNIVSIYDVGTDGSDHYIVMEYVRSKTLKDKIREEGPLGILTAVSIASDIANGLCHAHNNNIVHCDIKPHNILMTNDGHAKIADFGIARAVTESTLTDSGNVVGSVHYFSPEQAQGGVITPKSDIYSLGVVMYEMLTNRLPFTGDNAVAIAMKHIEEEPVPPNVFREDIPPLLAALVLRTMSKNPELRPTGLELIQALINVRASLNSLPHAEDPDATQFLPRVSKSTNTPAQKKVVEKVEESKPADKEEVQKEKNSSSTNKFFIAGILMFLLIGISAGSFVAFGDSSGEDLISVPDVTGKQLTLARQILEDGHLRVNIAETYDANVPAGEVVSQDPNPGRNVKNERLVTIYVSKGGETIDMPDLIGLTRKAATERLQKIGLKIGTIYEKDSPSHDPDMILSHDPATGTKINRGQTIDLVVSKGTHVAPIEEVVAERIVYEPEDTAQRTYVPDVYSTGLDAARASIEGHGLSVGSVTYRTSEQADGTVISQSPPPDAGVEYGTSVDLVLAKHEEPPPTHNKEPEVFAVEQETPTHHEETVTHDDNVESNYSYDPDAVQTQNESAPVETPSESPAEDFSTDIPSDIPSPENSGIKQR